LKLVVETGLVAPNEAPIRDQEDVKACGQEEEDDEELP
jgi:hypothetical protein